MTEKRIKRINKSKSLIGKQFGDLTVIGLDESWQGNVTKYICKCNLCGKIISRHRPSLFNNKYQNCGCTRKKENPLIIDMIGKKFGKLTVIKETGRDKQGQRIYLCKCDCGNLKEVRGYLLRSRAKSISCGKCKFIKYSFSNVSIYSKYIKLRHLHNIKEIILCDEWLNNPKSFEEWYIKTLQEQKENIDKFLILKDPQSKIYSPENCTFGNYSITHKDSKKYEYNGKYYTLRQICMLNNISVDAICKRRKRGWKEEELFEPRYSGRRVNVYTKDGEFVGHFNSIKDCSVGINTSVHQITQCVNNEREITTTGYVIKEKKNS